MTRKEFIKILDDKGYSYEIEGDKIVVTGGYKYGDDVDLPSLETLPPGVVFKNGGNVDLKSLKTLPPGVVFNNRGDVFLESLETLPPGVVFKNVGNVWLHSLKTIYPSVVFENRGLVKLDLLMGKYVVWFSIWNGNIDGIDSKRLLNLTIKRGLFI